MAITKVQQSALLTGTFSNGNWSSATTALTSVAAGNLVLAFGGWWDAVVNTGGSQNIPADSNGTFVKAGTAAPNLPAANPPTPPGWPVAPELCEILSAAAGTHTCTPQSIFPGGGDGYFLAAEFTGGAGTWSRVDDGYAFAGSGTAGAVNGVTVTTAGTAALIGDLVVTIVTTDGDPTAFGMGSPSGTWNNILTTSTTSNNIGMGAAWQIATANGAQSAVYTVTDNDCELANAVIAVYRLTASGVTLTGQSSTSAAGTLTGNISVALTGQGAAFAAGTLTPARALALNGQAATFAAGTLVPSRTVALTGQQAVFTAGTISPQGNLTLALTGQAAAFAAGTLTPATALAVSGQSATFAAGALSPSASLALLGQSAASASGALTPAASLALLGKSATFAQGAITAGSDLTLALSGQSATFSSGTLIPARSVALNGQSVTVTAGTVFASGGPLPSITCAGGTFDSLTPMTGLMI